MSEAEDLARRFLALWADYLTALGADPAAADMLGRGIERGAAAFGAAAFGLPLDPPIDPGPGDEARPAAGTAAVAGASGQHDAAVAELARRVAVLEQRVAALERGDEPVAARLVELQAAIERHGTEAVGRALDAELARRAGAFAAGLELYRRHPYRRAAACAPVLWRQGTTRLLDYGRSGGGGGRGVLVVPSLVNRYYVLDLLRERSFLRYLAGRGLRPLVVDWGVPGPAERGFGLDDYVALRLEAAFAAAREATGAPLAVIGYCMGGLLALALALRRRAEIAGLTLLATPWNFHAERTAQARLLARIAEIAGAASGPDTPLPVAAVQGLFLGLDPFLAERKFRHFADLEPESDAARDFVALEDWLNDGVPLAAGVARDCARSWYGENAPGNGVWRVAGEHVRPALLRRPALVVLPSRDHLVPPRSAEPLAAALAADAPADAPGDVTVLRPPLGHIGMMTATAAPIAVWPPIADWLCARLDA